MGTVNQPFVRLTFSPYEPVTPDSDMTMLDWVKALPGRRWNAANQAWDATAFTSDPHTELTRAGFTVADEQGTDQATLKVTLAEYRDVMLAKITKKKTTTLVRPRLMPYDEAVEVLGAGASWDKARGRFEVPTTDIIDSDGDWPLQVDFVDHDAATIGKELHNPVAPTEHRDPADVVIPSWFGLDLYPYQAEGIKMAACGKTAICDPPGLGKTRQGLGVAAVVEAKRTIIVTPPVMLTGWSREADQAGIAHGHDQSGQVTEEGQIVVWQARRKKLADPPERGVVIVSDSLLVSRPNLLAALTAWRADVMIVDEAHRQKTWSSQRSKTIRDLAATVTGPRVALTGTPLFANPVELAGVLGITGHLTPVFGGYGKFVIRYAQQNKFKKWVPRKRMLPELRRRLTESVWVRRERDDVLDLPAMSRHTLYVDVDLRGFNEAHEDVIAEVDEWIAEVRKTFGRDPNRDEVRDFAANSLHLVTMLRRAAGLAKIPPAADYVKEWVEVYPPDADGVWPSPLILWTHHQTVTAAMLQAAREAVGDDSAVAVIDGGTSQDSRTITVDRFQEGRIGVLVASITAAGVGITLTRSTDAIYVETDWTPALIQQSDMRINRIGQTKPTRVTTLVAPGTLDEYIHSSLFKKGEILEMILGGDQNVSADIEGDHSTPIQIITDIIYDRLAGKPVSVTRSKPYTRRKEAV